MLISKENLRILLKALKEEPPKIVLTNAYRKLRGFEQNNHFANNDFKLHLDALAWAQSRLCIKGWIITADDKSEISLILDEHIEFEISQNQSRPDVIQRFNLKPTNDPIGFIAQIDLPQKPKRLQIILKTDHGRSVHFNIDSTYSLKSFLHLPFHQQYLFYLNKQNVDFINKSVVSESLPISIITPTYNTLPRYLDLCIQSLINQTYQHWEMILYDDASTNQDTLKCLNKWEKSDSRIKIVYGSDNQHISKANNAALSHASGTFVGFLDHDDELAPSALHEVALAIQNNSEIDLLYSDEDKIDKYNIHSGPYFKPAFSIDHIRSNNFMCHFLVIRKSLGDQIRWFTPGMEGAQDYDLILKVIDQTSPDKIYHIPKVLYHWRMIEGSTALKFDEKNYALEAGQKAIEAHLSRNEIQGKVTFGPWKGAYRVHYNFAPSKISILIPFKDQVKLLKQCIKSILKHTVYPNYEIVLLDNQSQAKRTLTYLKKIQNKHAHIQVLKYNHPFNFSAINNYGVHHTKGDHILLLNNDIKVITDGWLTAMAEHIHRPEIGAVGGKLLYKDETIQHASVVTGIGGSAGHIFKGQPNGHHYFTMGLIRNVGAVTGACILVKKSIYQEVGGLDEENLKIAYNDIDLCLKIRKAGYLITYTPYAELYHFESKSRGYEDTPEKQARHDQEKDFLAQKWGDFLMKDPYYNPNFSRQTERLSIHLEQHE